MRTQRLDIESSCKRFATVKATVNLAKKVGVNITGHMVEYNKRGQVAVHWLFDGREWKRNERLKGWLRIMADSLSKTNTNVPTTQTIQ